MMTLMGIQPFHISLATSTGVYMFVHTHIQDNGCRSALYLEEVLFTLPREKNIIIIIYIPS